MGAVGSFPGGGGGLKINGVLRKYGTKSGEVIDKGDFVSFVHEWRSPKVSKYLNSTYVPSNISSILLPNDRILILYSRGDYGLLYGIVVDISKDSIVNGAETLISGSSYSASYEIALDLLPNGDVFVVYNYNSSVYVYGAVLRVSGTSITVKLTDQPIQTTVNYGKSMAVKTLSDGNVLIAHPNASSLLCGTIVNIGETSITKLTDSAVISTETQSGLIGTKMFSLTDGKILIAHSYNSNVLYMYCIVISVNGTTITKGTDTLIVANNAMTYKPAFTLYPNGDVLITHSYSASGILYGTVLRISDCTISKGTTTAIANGNAGGAAQSPVSLPDSGTILVFHRSPGDYSNYLVASTLKPTTDLSVLVDSTTGLTTVFTENNSGYFVNTILSGKGRIFLAIAYSSSRYLYGSIVYDNYMKAAKTRNDVISGVAKEKSIDNSVEYYTTI